MRSVVVVTERGRRFPALQAQTRRERARGLLGADAPTWLVLPHARSVHTFGLARTIDVLLLDGSLRVRRVVRMRSRRLLLPRRGVRHLLEVPSPSPIAEGERIALVRGPAADPKDGRRAKDGGGFPGPAAGGDATRARQAPERRSVRLPPGASGHHEDRQPPDRPGEPVEELLHTDHLLANEGRR